MYLLKRNPANPILKPVQANDWESYAAFNGSVVKRNGQYHLFYRAMTDEITYLDKKMRLSSIGHAVSTDGVDFGNRTRFVKPELDFELFGCEDPRVTEIEGKYYVFYTALSGFPPNYRTIKCAVAVSHDLESVSEKHLVTPFNAKAMALFPEKINGKYTVLLSVNTDRPPSNICFAQFERVSDIWNRDRWSEWYENYQDYVIPLTRVSTDQVEIGATPLKTDAGWVLIHSYIKNYFSDRKIFRIEAVLLDRNDPKAITGRIIEPCLEPEAPYEKEGQIRDVVFPEGALIEDGLLKVYYGAADSTVCLAETPLKPFMEKFETNTPVAPKCIRFPNNPLLTPDAGHEWERKAVFNPAALVLEGKTYLVYRTLSEHDVSYLGCAVSEDGIFIDERIEEPIYKPRVPEETNSAKPGGYGCEDPRITLINETLYLCYTAYDGTTPRLAMASISKADFLGRNWDKWSKPKIISPPGIPDKDGCLFPEKINGKYAFFHRIEPDIVIDFVDDLEFREKPFLESSHKIQPRANTWDDIKIGINAPPLWTSAGWLVFYHGISRIDRHYRLGALLLDPQDITKVIARTEYPILEPVEYYEKEGIVNNVVFPCGFTVKDNDILLYYGGADKVVAGAMINLKLLVDYLLRARTQKFLAQT